MEQNTQNTALLIMDMQNAILNRLPDNTPVIHNSAKAIAHARIIGIPLIYVTVGFRQGAPEINLNNKIFAAVKERYMNTDMSEFMKIVPALQPMPEEVIVIKRRISAFSGSDLEVILSAYGIRHMILCGFATSGVVLSTIRQAADKDYILTVLSDCCADADEEVHRVLTTKVFPRQADVFTVEEWIQTSKN
jgi:nicotinamidase-related amidase